MQHLIALVMVPFLTILDVASMALQKLTFLLTISKFQVPTPQPSSLSAPKSVITSFVVHMS
jgi:hypothetical protein